MRKKSVRITMSLIVATVIMSMLMPMFVFAAPNQGAMQVGSRSLVSNDWGAKDHANRTGGLFNLNPSLAEAKVVLDEILEYAKAIDLSAYPHNLAKQVSHAVSRAMSLCNSATANDINIARLRLQVAVDALKVDLQQVNVSQLQEMVRAGTLTYVELMRMYLSRIELYDFNTIKINSVLALNPNAFEIAAAKDAMVAADPSLATGIFGMTVLVKDNIGTIGSEGMATTAGSVALRYNYAPFDATIITGIREAGGIIFGKVNLAEFANWTANGTLAANAPARTFYLNRFGVPYPHPGNAPNGHSSLGGQVLNPYNVDIAPQGWPVLSASGSSTGSGSAAAAALSAVTIGSETSGSILAPARATSTVGIKPTVGLLSRYGIIPLAAAYDTAGPMTRNVHDAAALLTAMARFDANDVVDNYHTSPDFTLDYTEFLNRNALQGKRLGVVGGAATMNNTPEGQRAREILEYLGAIIVTDVSITGGVQTSVMNFEFYRDLNNYLARMTDPRLQVRTVLDIIDYYHHNPETTPAWGFHNLINAHIDTQTAEQNETIRNNSIMNARNSIDNALRTYNLDALISFAGLSGPGAAAGYPSVNVPFGYNVDAAIPSNNRHWNPFFSLNFTGTAFSEASLIAMAYAFEQASMVRIPPGMAVRDDLRNLISRVEAMDESMSIPVLTVLNEARAVASSNFSTQMCVDLAYNRLKAAITTLELTYTLFAEDWRESINLRFFLGDEPVEIPLADMELVIDGVQVENIRDFTLNIADWQTAHHTIFICKLKHNWQHLTFSVTTHGQTLNFEFTNSMFVPPLPNPILTTTIFAEDWRETINIRFFLDGEPATLPLENIVIIADGIQVENIRDFTVNIADWQTSTNAIFISRIKTPWTTITVNITAYGQTLTYTYVNNL